MRPSPVGATVSLHVFCAPSPGLAPRGGAAPAPRHGMIRTIDRAQIRNALLFAASVCLTLVVLSREGWALWWLRHATYFTTFAATGVWLVRFAAWARGRFRSPIEALRDTS